LLDAFLELVTARSRPNTVLATGFDLKVFFSVVGKDPVDVDTADVLAFIAAQREPRHGATVVRIEDGERGLSARTIKRRLATIAGLYEYLLSAATRRWCVTRCRVGWRCAATEGGQCAVCR
jgi:site-specific recombinase XerD